MPLIYSRENQPIGRLVGHPRSDIPYYLDAGQRLQPFQTTHYIAERDVLPSPLMGNLHVPGVSPAVVQTVLRALL